MGIIYAIENDVDGKQMVNFRVYELEMAAKHFGKMKVLEPILTDIEAFCSQVNHGDVVSWRPNSEWFSGEKHEKIKALQKILVDRGITTKFINSAYNWMNCHCKIECFKDWQKAKIQTPHWEQVGDFLNLDSTLFENFPYLIRVNNESSGYVSYVIKNKDELLVHYPKLLKEQKRLSRERKNNPLLLYSKFLDTERYGYRRSYRIIVAGGKVITGYARLCKAPEWVATTGYFKEEMKGAFIQVNKDLEKYIEKEGEEIVRSVNALGLNFVGVDVVPVWNGKFDEHYFLEVQPGFSVGYADPRRGYLPPFYNPSYPALRDWLISEKDFLCKEMPMYYNTWLDKMVMFDKSFASLKESLN